MTTLREHKFQVSYSKDQDNIAEEFYLPCLSVSDHYDRISGYFGSTIYILAWSALQEFVENGGKIRLICSPIISDADKNAITEGYSAINDVIEKKSLSRELDELFSYDHLSKPARA